MTFPNSLAELKRYIKSLENTGKMTLLDYRWKGTFKLHSFLMRSRTISSVNSVGFGLTYKGGVESFCSWPKAKNLMFYPENRVIHISFGNNSTLVYRIEEEGNEHW
jgi:hypothetical protein